MSEVCSQLAVPPFWQRLARAFTRLLAVGLATAVCLVPATASRLQIPTPLAGRVMHVAEGDTIDVASAVACRCYCMDCVLHVMKHGTEHPQS